MSVTESVRTKRDGPQRELDKLLSEPPHLATARMAQQARAHERDGDSYALYGAGNLGRTVLAKLRHAGVEPVAFVDDTPAKQNQIIDGLPVIPVQKAAVEFGTRLVFVVTILNPLLNYITARRRLKEATDRRVISFLHLAWRFPESFFPFGQFESPVDLLANASDIRQAFELFSEKESRRQFVAHLRFRLQLDHESLPACVADNYFPVDLVPRLPPETIFVDCGAYDGDSIRAFLAHQQGHFGRIFAFEPDPRNCKRLRAYVASLGRQAERVSIFNAGVGEQRETLRFDSAGNMSSSFNASGNLEVEVFPIDDVVQVNGGPIFLKFDVEGAERAALQGGLQLIKRTRPLMALSVYHRPDDLWQVPLFVRSLDLDYDYFLRTQGEDGTDVIAYFLPG